MNKRIHQKDNRWRFFIVAVAVLLLGILSGCATVGSQGRLQNNLEVSDMFVNGPLSPDYNYYFSGPRNNPRAIMGLDKKFYLESNRWQSVDPASGQIQTMMRALTNQKGFAKANFGSVILDPDGNRIGVWYSREARRTRVIMLGDNFVSIFPPTAPRGVPAT
jgi:hypothetical protein